MTAIPSERVPAVNAVVPVDFAGARRWLWRAFVIIIVGGWAGATWDRVWHASVPFDGFWSPPHLVVYATVAVVSFIFMGLLFHAPLRRAFGRGFSIGVLPFRVPGALALLGGGLLLLGFAGAVLDNLWHTAFGLNETAWSFPHAMIGWSLLIVALGFLSGRLAMSDQKPLPAFTRGLLAFVIVTLALGTFTGPLGSNRTADEVRFFYTYIPSLASQESAQHVFRIYDAWNLNRSHPGLMLLAPLWLGAALGLLRTVTGRGLLTFSVLGLVWLFDFGNREVSALAAQALPGLADEASWRALPILLPAAAALLLPRLRVSERISTAAAGALFALLIFDIWGTRGSGAWLLALAAAPAALLGQNIGARAAQLVAQPWTPRAVLTLLGCAVLVPLVTGILDLLLRAATV